ncbi:hypothetical protein MHU86_5806 [Fragilaria crotonensis]|nr:hypothetical protein MHU86_5806 [Fragilaria crotonensis]
MDNITAPDEVDNNLFYSPAEKENLLVIKKEFDGEFPIGTAFATRRHAIDAMRRKAATFGFFIVDRAMKGSQEVTITKVQFMHGKGCKPSGEQFKAAWTTGGHASRHLARTQNLKLHTIVQLLASEQRPSARMMRSLLCDMLPKDFNVSSQFIHNVKTKVKLKLMNGDFDLLLSEGTVSEGDAEFILSPSDNLPPEYQSIAQEIANDVLKRSSF